MKRIEGGRETRIKDRVKRKGPDQPAFQKMAEKCYATVSRSGRDIELDMIQSQS